MTRRYGNQSMTAPLKRALLKQPAETEDDIQQWQEFGYRWRPNREIACREHEHLAAALRAAGVDVHVAAGTPSLLDSVFTTDPGFVTDAGAIIGNMRKPLRRGEEDALEHTLRELGIPILGRLEGEATLEGGDVLWLDPETLVIGRSFRTNDAGFAQVREMLDGKVRNILQVHMPYWHGPSEILHLTSSISLVADDIAIVYPPVTPIPLYEMLVARHVRIVEVPEREFESQGSNALALAPGHVVIPMGNPITVSQLRALGVTVTEFPGWELSVCRDGGPTCLTCGLLREY